MEKLEDVVRSRRSVRGFDRDRLVPRDTLREVFELSQWAPSNCNVQPWRVYVASGGACDRVRQAMLTAFDGGNFGDPEEIPDAFLGDYRRLQVECAVELYGHMGIARDDKPGRMRALRRNFELFDAPHVAVLCMEKSFGLGVALDVGAYLQTLLLAMTARGIAACPQVSLRNYPALLRKELRIPEKQRVLCGISFGYENMDVPANRTRQTREPVDKNVVFFTE